MEEAARAKKEFITNVTHELRTPLTLIRGWMDYILDSRQTPEPLVPMLDQMQTQTLSLTNKINELLKISRFDADMAVMTLKKTDMDAFVFEIVSSFRGITEGRQLELNYQSQGEFPPIFMDQEKLKDILNNLIRNAYKFTEVGEITVSLDWKESHLTLTIQDTGVGMSSRVMETIFQRFRQGDSSKTRRYEGTGLGLAIVKESVDFLKGEIQVESHKGEGTCFTITLPCNLEELEPKSIIDRRKAQRRKQRMIIPHKDRRNQDRRVSDLAAVESSDMVKIDLADSKMGKRREVKEIHAEEPKGVIVVAEDNSGIQDLIAKALADYSLYLTPDGEVGWETIKSIMPDLVISDVMMPFKDGFSLLKTIRSHKATTSMPVIILTSLSDRVDRIKALQMGADEFVTKPFHHLELQARVKNVIGLHRLEREQTRRSQLETFLMVLASAIESKDRYTGGHVERVAQYARDMARKLKLPESQIQEIYLGTIVHDVGKIGIKNDILNKKGPLTAEEYTHIQEHPVIGKNLLSQLKIAPVAVNITYYHQERWDGSGYPTGMRGKAIPQEARIAAIADFWDAITTDRPYREAMPLVEALAVIKAQRGKGLDPELLDIFLDPGDRIFMRYLPPEKRSPLE